MKTETYISKPNLAVAEDLAVLEIHFAAAFPVEFVIHRLEDVPLRIHKAEVELPPVTARPPAITLQEL
jgi:hypothetical protein